MTTRRPSLTEAYLLEEIEKWARGELPLTSEGLLEYWQQEWVQNLDRIQYFESTLRHSSPSQASHDDCLDRFESTE